MKYLKSYDEQYKFHNESIKDFLKPIDKNIILNLIESNNDIHKLCDILSKIVRFDINNSIILLKKNYQ